MADYHMLGDGVYGVGAAGGMMEDSAGMVSASSYGHPAASASAPGPGMMPQGMPGAPSQNPMQGLVSHQQAQPVQSGPPMASGPMTAYHQGTVHAYPQSEVPQKLHQYPGYGSQLQTGNMSGQYVSGPRLHHLNDSMMSPGSQSQQQQAPARTVVSNQMAYQNSGITNNHYGQQLTHVNATSTQLPQNTSQYPSQYGSVTHHQLPHTTQQVNMNQNADMWQSPVRHSPVTRPCMPASQGYSHQVSVLPGQHGSNSMTHNTMSMQATRPSTPNTNQYIAGQEYNVQHASSQPSTMPRPPAYNLNSPSVAQNGAQMTQVTGTPQPGMSQSLGSLSQNEQVMAYPQGPYSATQAGQRPHYNPASSGGNTGASSQSQLMGQPMMGMRPMHQMGYSPMSSRVNSGQQHGGAIPSGSPARLQQYHAPFSPNQPYSSATQPSPHSAAGGTATPPHIPLYANSQAVPQTPNSPQYRNPFPSQVTQSPQHLTTPTPPAESPMPPSSHTPDRNIHSSSTPQSQGSYSSPSATHMTSPGHGHSPGNTNAPSNSLQHLEQMVLPRMASGPSTSTAASVSPGTPNAMMSHTSAVGGGYYGHLTPQHAQTQHHPHLSSTSGDNRPQPHSPAFSSQSHPAYMAPTAMPVGHISSNVNNVPNSQSIQSSNSAMNSLVNPNSNIEDRSLQESGPHNSAVGYSTVAKANGIQGVVGPESTSSLLSVNSSNLLPSIPNIPSAPASNHLTPVPNPPSGALPVCSSSSAYMVGKPTYQQETSSLNYEIQKIQQELQHLYGMHQSQENQEKIKNLQDRLCCLQMQSGQTNTVSPVPPAVSNQTMTPQYPRPSMLYSSPNPASYMHQQPLQPHTVHYNPQTQMTPVKQDIALMGSPQDYIIKDLDSTENNAICSVAEQEAADPGSLQQNCFTAPADVPLTLPPTEKSEMPPDPYELNFTEEPLTKMKRPPKKSESKEPKEPKPKKPRPKKPKKPKNTEETTGANEDVKTETTSDVKETENGNANLENQENVTPKKAKKRKAKDKENKDGSETKEPKPKKPRKKSPKQPKKPKEDAVVKDGGENVNTISPTTENVEGSVTEGVPETAGGEAGENEEKEAKDGKKKENKDKKESKSKTPKTPNSAKENKPKSTPKKKLPKIALKFSCKKKKKKRVGSSDNSDLEKTPPPSPQGADGIQKRRSARNTKRKKYTDDIELHLTDDETIEMDFTQPLAANSDGKAVHVVLDNHTEDYMVVEKILAARLSKLQPSTNTTAEGDNDNPVPEVTEVEEYFVKYKNLSYIHCEWKTFEELEKGDRRFSQKVKRFRQKKDTFNFFDFLEEEPFNPDYVEVDRVLDVNEIEEVFCEPKTEGEVTQEQPDEDKGEVSQEQPAEDKADVQESDQPLIPEGSIVESKVEPPDKPQSETTQSDEVAASGQIEESEASESPKDASENITLPELGAESSQLLSEAPSELQDEDLVTAPIADKTDVVDKPEESMPCPEEIKEDKETAGQKEEKDPEPQNDVSDVPKKTGKITRHYLVKWRALTYEESTWELEEDVDRVKIEHFLRFRNPPPKEKWKVKKRPKPSEWEQLEESPVYKGGNTLREYQLEGVNWLAFCWYNAQNCILADEMGLGKTIQSITFLNEINKYGIPGPFLIIAPLSTIGNWQREFETWTEMNAITYHGSSPSRNMIQEYEMYWKNEKGERIIEVYKFQVMITTFEIILTDCLELKSIPWRCVIIDEAHRLKNRNCKLLEGLRLLETEHRVLLTGTPLQNNVEELFSLLNFLEPNRFASTEAFLEEFGDLKTEAQVDKLKALLKPMMLRRLKEDVEKSLAPKEETVIEVELTNVQKKYYRAILERNFSFLTKGGSYSNMPNLMNTMMELRKCCIHPFLINGAEEQIINDYKNLREEVVDTSINVNAMIQASGKLVLIDKLLPRLRANGHRVLVFSQMVRCLDILEDYMVQKRYPYERIDGRVRGNLRQAAIDRFCKPDSDRFVFLLCTRAGGLGINLTAADTVIIFDSDWNPQNDLQAQARCHRIGQSKAVKVYRLICRNTYEREMFDKASLKLGLDKAVLQSMCPQKESLGMNQQMSKKEIEDLLRKGAYGALMEDDNAGDKFCEEDIDQILQRRTQIIQLESGTKGSTFAKATFAASSTRSDIEIDDPNFWEKWAKKANLDVDELKNRNELIIEEPRRRTQTRRFGTDDHMLDLSELDTSDDDDESVSTRTRASKRSSKNSSRSKNKNRGRALDREREDYMLEAIAPGNWTRAECYKVEKGLLTFGWGRWDECIALGQFRRLLTHKDVEEISRIILLYCLLHYKGDEKIKGFIWDLISPSDDGEERIHRNHSAEILSPFYGWVLHSDTLLQGDHPLGPYLRTFESELTLDKDGGYEGLSTDFDGLSAPVPRGRKGKKMKKEMKCNNSASDECCEWAKDEKYNPEILLGDDSYKKHLNRHANRVLLRVRLLYYLKHEVIGDLHHQVFAGIPASEIPLQEPNADGEPPAPWWDQEADRSLLIGIYKHGFERYNLMRQDPTLCFLVRCGPPDGAALLAELNVNEDELEDQGSQKEANDKDDNKDDKDVDDLEALSPASETSASKISIQEGFSCNVPPPPALPNFDTTTMMGMLPFPTVTDLNTRLRRIITAYQRTNKKQEQRMAQKAKKIERREKFEAAIRERELKKRELQQRWSRREEADFYRTISSFGVEYNHDKTEINWKRFRSLARLERKFDETLAEYFKAFYAMCKRVCGRKLSEEEEQLTLIVEPISEERASRCLQRIDLLNKIREEILSHPELDERLKLCQPSMDLPDWWQCGKHDKDLLIGAARHGLSRMDYHLLHDPDLSFREVMKNLPNPKIVHINSHIPTPLGCSSPVTTCHSLDDSYVFKDELNMPNFMSNESRLLLAAASRSEERKIEMVGEGTAEIKSKNIIENLAEDAEKIIQNLKETFVKNALDHVPLEPPNENKIKCDVVPKIEFGLNPKPEVSDAPSMDITENKDDVLSDVKEELTEVKVEIPQEKVEKDEPVKEVDSELKEETPPCIGETHTEDMDEAKTETDKDEDTDIEMDLRKDEEDEEARVSISNVPEETKCAEIKTEPPKEEPEQKVSLDAQSNCDVCAADEVKEIKVENPCADLPESKEQDQQDPSLPSDSKNLFCEKPEKLDILDDCMKTSDNISKNLKEDIPCNVDDSQECGSQNDDRMSQASFNLETDVGEPTVAQLLAVNTGNSIRWPKDKVLQIRLEHVVQAIEKNEWPLIRHTFLPNFPVVCPQAGSIPNMTVTASPSSHRASPVPSISSQAPSGEATPQATPEHTPQREPIIQDIPMTPAEFSTPNKSPMHSMNTDPIKHRRRRRRRRFEIEAERAKLRALLSHNMQQQQQQHHQQQMQHVQQFLASTNSSLLRPKLWEEHLEEKPSLATAPSPVPSIPVSSSSVPPPAHQNSSPRLATTLGSLDLRVKPNITPPAPFTPSNVVVQKRGSPVEVTPKSEDTPASPMDLSSTSVGTAVTPPQATDLTVNHPVNNSVLNGSALKSQNLNKPKDKVGAKGGSRIDALALNLQARKQKQMMQEQHHKPNDILSLLAEKTEKIKEIEEPEELSHRHQFHHHQDKRTVEDEEIKLRKKRLNDEALRKTPSRTFDMTPAPAHSSYLSSSTPGSSSRLHLGQKTEESSASAGTPILDHSALMHHDFKKWLEDHPELIASNPNLVAAAAAAMAFSPMPSFPAHTELLELPEGRRRGRRPRLDPSKLDYDKVTGEENVSVINRLTGKKITGSKAPPLKHLAEWLDKNPMFDVDPKWGPLVRQKGNLPNNLAKRIVTPSEKRGRRTAASLLASAHQNIVPPPPTTMPFSSAAGLNPLSFANAGMLTGFPNMKFFMDSAKASSSATTTTSSSPASASTPPIFLPFGGLAGMGLANPLFGFPGFNFQGLQGTPMGNSSIPSSSSSKDPSKDGDNKSKGEKSVDSTNSTSRSKTLPASSTSTSNISSSTTTMPSATSLPFLYPAPGLLYNPLGLGSFTLPPNLPASFASFTQSGLVNGLGLSNPLVTTSTIGTTSSSTLCSSTATVSTTSHAAANSLTAKTTHANSNKHFLQPSLLEGQDSDDESLKSLMGNHDDDDDDFDDGKLDSYNLDKDDSDKETNRDSVSKSPVSLAKTCRTSSKASESESESINLVKTSSYRHSIELKSNKSKGLSDDPTSDSTDTESKHS